MPPLPIRTATCPGPTGSASRSSIRRSLAAWMTMARMAFLRGPG